MHDWARMLNISCSVNIYSLLTHSHLEWTHSLTHEDISSLQSKFLRNLGRKYIVPVGFDDPSSKIFKN